jgi:3-oxoacyl-[acyl-carrier-protein] synthase II
MAPLRSATVAARPLFRPVDRFAAPTAGPGAVAGEPAPPAAALAGSPALGPLLAEVVAEARAAAGCARSSGPLLLALHADARTAAVVSAVDPAARVYTGACVAAATAVADAAAAIVSGREDRVVVAAGYLVERDTYALFAAGRALARDGAVRPFSRDRTGVLLGDAVVAVVLESSEAARARGGRALARLTGWGRAGDAHHVCRPAPDGSGLSRAARSALARARVTPDRIGYVNANGAGSALGDASESRALHDLFTFTGDGPLPGDGLPPGSGLVAAGRLFPGDGPHGKGPYPADGLPSGDGLTLPPVGATKSVHGHALEASALLELAVTIAALEGSSSAGVLPGTAGWLGPDDECGVRPLLPTDPPPVRPPTHALTLNAAFGGANTALLLAAA